MQVQVHSKENNLFFEKMLYFFVYFFIYSCYNSTRIVNIVRQERENAEPKGADVQYVSQPEA